MGETSRAVDHWLILAAIVVQVAVLVLVAGLSIGGLILAGILLLTVCMLTPRVWRQRHRYQGIDMVVVPLVFGGLGVVVGQVWVGSLALDSAVGVQGTQHDLMHRLLIMATMLALCLPACVLLCSHSTCSGRRRTVILELTVLHLMMMAGMFTASWIVMLSHSSEPGPVWTYVGGLIGMGSGAMVVVLALQWRTRRTRCKRRGPRHHRGT